AGRNNLSLRGDCRLAAGRRAKRHPACEFAEGAGELRGGGRQRLTKRPALPRGLACRQGARAHLLADRHALRPHGGQRLPDPALVAIIVEMFPARQVAGAASLLPRPVLPAHLSVAPSSVNDVYFGPDSQTLATAGPDQAICLWQVSDSL